MNLYIPANILALCLLLSLSGCVENQDKQQANDPFADDIPSPVPGKVSLAGAQDPDIVRFLKVQSAISPSLSADGAWLAYRTRLTGDFQVWVTRSQENYAPRQITFGNSVTFHEWSPAGNEILYGTDKEGNEREGFYLISADGTTERELLPPSDAFRFFGGFNRTGSQFIYSTTGRNGRDFDIHLYDIETGTDQYIYPGKLGYYPVSISPSGRYVLISESVGEDAVNLYKLDVRDSSLIMLSPEGALSEYGNFQWLNDESGFYLTTNEAREFLNVAFYSLENNTMEFVIDHETDIEQIILSEDEKVIHWIANESGYSAHYIYNIPDGRTSEGPQWPAGIINLTRAPGADIYAAHVTSPQIPGDIWTWDNSDGTLFRATHSATAGLDMTKMVLPEPHRFEARDGLMLHGLLYAPDNMGGEMPVVITVHGGPTSQARPDFDALTQYLTQKGFIVFDLNYRGSTGFGKSFARENNLRKREVEYFDLEDAVAYLSAQGIGDTDHVAVMGGSYGGYLTMAAMSRLPDIFDCGVAFVGVSNWVTALEGASPALKASDRLEYGDIDDPEDRAFFKSISPIEYIDQVKSPVMILHGANDPRDPVTESDLFVEKIRNNGGEVEYLRFPDEGHGIRKMENRITAYVRVADFLEENLKKASVNTGED